MRLLRCSGRRVATGARSATPRPGGITAGARSATPRPGGITAGARSATPRPGGITAALLLAVLLLVILGRPVLAQIPLPGFLDPIQPPRPVIVGSGVDELLGLREQAQGTWLGTYGTGPYALTSHLGVTDIDHQVQGQWASYLWSLVVWIARVLVALMNWAFTVDLFAPLTGVIDGVVGALSSSIWQPLVIPTIVLVGLWAAWRGIVRRQMSTVAEGWLWMVLAIAAGIFFFTQPSSIATAVNTFAAKMSNVALSAVAAVDPGLCQTSEGKCATGSAHLAELTDRLWYLYVIKPFVVMEFGDGDLEEPYLKRLLEAKTITRGDLASVGGGGAAPDALIEAKAEAYRALAEDLSNQGDAYEWFTGRRNNERGMVAGMALVAVLVSGIVLGVVAAGVLVAQLGLLLAFLLAPLFLALGIHPGFGRRIAVRWGQLSIGMVIKRIGLSVLLAVMLVVSGSIMTAADSAGGWYAAVILHILLGVAALLYRKPFMDLLARAGPGPRFGLPPAGLKDRATALKNTLGIGFAYTIGRQAVVGKGVQSVQQLMGSRPQRPRPPAVGGGTGGGRPPGGGGGAGGGGSGGGGGRSGGGGAGGAGAAPAGSGASSGSGASGSSRAMGAAAASGGGSSHGGDPRAGTRPVSHAHERRHRDLHVPYQRDEQQRIVEPQRRRRRPTSAELLRDEGDEPPGGQR